MGEQVAAGLYIKPYSDQGIYTRKATLNLYRYFE